MKDMFLASVTDECFNYNSSTGKDAVKFVQRENRGLGSGKRGNAQSLTPHSDHAAASRTSYPPRSSRDSAPCSRAKPVLPGAGDLLRSALDLSRRKPVKRLIRGGALA